MIKKVEIRNWKSHLDSKFFFTQGTNALIGIIGSGKSSLLDAICFGFFGTFPSLQSKKIKLDDVIMNRPRLQNKLEIEITFFSNNKEYKIKRIVERGKGTTYAEIKENGKILEAPSSARVNEIIKKILKIDYELFSKIIYSEQNSLDYFLNLPKGQRMKKIDELLSIDKFEKCRASCVSLINKIKEVKYGKEKFVEISDLNKLKNEIIKITNEIFEIEKENKNIEKNIEILKNSINEKEVKLYQLKNLEKKFESLKLEKEKVLFSKNEVETSLKELEKSLKEEEGKDIFKILEKLSLEVKNLENLFENKRKEYEETLKKSIDIKSKIEVLEKETLLRLENEIKELEKEKIREKDLEKEIEGSDFENKKREIDKIEKNIEVNKQKILEEKKWLEELEKIEAKCPLCENYLDEGKKEKLKLEKRDKIIELEKSSEILKNELEKRKEEIKILERKIKELEECKIKLEKYEKIKKEFDEYRNFLIEMKEEYKEVEKILNEMKKEIGKIEEEMKEKNKEVIKYENLYKNFEEFEKKKEKLKEIEKKLGEIEKNLEEFKNVNLDEIKILENILKEENEKIVELKAIFDSNQKIVEEKKRYKEENEKRAKEVEKIYEEVEKIEKIIKNLKIFEKAVEITQTQLRKEFVESVNYTMKQIWESLYPYQDWKNIKLIIEEGDYVLKLEDINGKWVNVEGIASGGERSLAALALRMAFALVLAPQLRLLFLDEPTSNLDLRAREELSKTLRENIHKHIDQIFIITHDEKLEEAANGSIYKLIREKEKEEPTKVIQIQ